MKVRLTGAKREVLAAVEELQAVFAVVVVSRPFPCRGDCRLVRVYVEVQV